MMNGRYYRPALATAFRIDQIESAPDQTRQELLVYALLSYLEFTCRLEDGPVRAACELVAQDRLPISLPEPFRAEASALLEEELRHLHSYREAQGLVERETGLTSPSSAPAFLQRLEDLVCANGPALEPWIRLLFVVVSETCITKQLLELASDLSIVPHVRQLVAAHARDEGRHHKYFRALFLELWPRIGSELRVTIARLIPDIIRAYLAPDERVLAETLARFPDSFTEVTRLAELAARADWRAGTYVAAVETTLRMFSLVGMFADPLASYRLSLHGMTGSRAAPFHQEVPVGSILTCLRHAAATRPAHAAVAFVRAEQERGRLSYEALDRRARAVAAELQRRHLAGERVLVLLDTGLEFVVAFLGVLYAGATAVPAHAPGAYRNGDRISRIADDSGATAVLTTGDRLEALQSLLGGQRPSIEWITVESIDDEAAEAWTPPAIAPEDPAFLQYTSGTTAAAKGVVIAHGNLLANASELVRAMAITPGSTVVSWLPLFHDMGLIGSLLAPLVCGATVILMPPIDFLGRPVRWLRAISRYRADISGGPDFAYAHCVDKIAQDQLEGLDLSSWRLAFNGSEQVRPETLASFTERFRSAGFHGDAFFPCYGLAESTLVVTNALSNGGPRVCRFDADSLERRQAVLAQWGGPRQRALVSCGRPGPDVALRIVDPETHRALTPGCVGEIWVESSSIARGYWNKPQETQLVFGAQLADERPASFLRTGDLGFLHDGELFVCGRQKDVIIVRGRSYPAEEFENAMRGAHPTLAHEIGAAFSVATTHGESVVLVCELGKASRPESLQALREVVRGSVVTMTDVSPHEIVFVARGAIPRSSSGKVQRRRCQSMHGEQTLRIVESP